MSFGIGQPGAGMNGILAAATANVLGGVKIGANVTVAGDGTISFVNSSISVNGVLVANVVNAPISINGTPKP
jgi:hypothetical protein